MAGNTAPIFPAVPSIGIATLTAATAVTSRANIAGVAGLAQLTPTSTNGKRIDRIDVKAKGNSVAHTVFVWLYNGTTSFLIDEIDVPAVTASNTADSALATKLYNNLVLPPTFQLYISQTIQSDENVLAYGGDF